jgi:hypothetical protein
VSVDFSAGSKRLARDSALAVASTQQLLAENTPQGREISLTVLVEQAQLQQTSPALQKFQFAE